MRYLGVVMLAFAMTCLAGDGPVKPKISILIKTDRPEAMYKCGEIATFSISVSEEEKPVTQGEVLVNISQDLGKALGQEKLKLGQEPVTIWGTLKEPGFLRCVAVYQKENNSFRGDGAAAFEPERIKAMTKMPEDFDSFWAAGRAELAKIPLDLQLTPLPVFSSDKHDTFKISFANIENTRIYGFLSVPKGRQPPFPAIVTVPPAGVGKPRGPSSGYAQAGALALDMSVHPHDLCLPAEEYQKLAKGPLADYFKAGAPHRERYYFRRAILGIDRAITWLASRPDFDKKHLVVQGSSQGGGFALILAGLNEHVTAAAANVPALCDHAGYLADRSPGWPRLVLAASEQEREEWLKMSAYFDAVNFARKIKCPVIVSVGFIDSTCAPSSVYAAYNEISSSKRIFHGPLTGHGVPPEFGQFSHTWILGQLGLEKSRSPAQPP